MISHFYIYDALITYHNRVSAVMRVFLLCGVVIFHHVRFLGFVLFLVAVHLNLECRLLSVDTTLWVNPGQLPVTPFAAETTQNDLNTRPIGPEVAARGPSALPQRGKLSV